MYKIAFSDNIDVMNCARFGTSVTIIFFAKTAKIDLMISQKNSF